MIAARGRQTQVSSGHHPLDTAICRRRAARAVASVPDNPALISHRLLAMLKSRALEQGRRLGDRHVKHILKHTSDKVGTRFKDQKAGFGMLNLVDALRLLEARLN